MIVYSPAPATPAEPSYRAMEQAAEWYALLCSEQATEADQERWKIWLEYHPEHRLAWRYVESVSRRFDPIQSTLDPRSTAEHLLGANSRLRKRRRVLKGLAGLAGLGLLGGVSARYTSLPIVARAWQADYRTETGEIRELSLPDGSRLWLNTETAVNQNYSAHQRRLQLVAGEMLVDTADDRARPFLVDTPHGRLRAVGTRFDVFITGGQTRLAVYQGAVKVRTVSGADETIAAGQQLWFDQRHLGQTLRADPSAESWRRGVLIARDISLAEVAAELRRYRHGYLGLSPQIADLRVFGQFPLNDTDQALDMLASVLPISIKRTLPWWVSIEPAGAP